MSANADASATDNDDVKVIGKKSSCGGNMFEDAVCMAPMVRASTLPLRLLALQYGADAVWGEEIIDRKIVQCYRVEGKGTGTVDYISKQSGQAVFRTKPELEKDRLVFQIGTANAVSAVKGASVVARDVAAMDLNMGCPKHFSVSGGMGVALCSDPDRACDIIQTLRRNLDIPVSAKIRLLPTDAKTVELCRRLEHAGCAAISVHAREKHERPRDKAHWDRFRILQESVNVPIIANGDIFTADDVQ
eukprot:g4783.t1